MARRVSTARVKIHCAYTVEEAAETVGVTEQTIRAWIKQGLPALTTKRPTLILGWALKAFLGQAAEKRRQPLAFGEFFCMRCKAPRVPALGLVDYTSLSDRHGNLSALCDACGGTCTRIVSKRVLPEWHGKFDFGRSTGPSA